MAGFFVDPPSVAGLGRLVTRNGEAVGRFVQELEHRRPDGYQEGLLGLLNEPLNEVQRVGEANTRHAAHLARTSGAEITALAAHYVRTDLAKARDLDAVHPGPTPTRLAAADVVTPDAGFDGGRDPAADPANPARPYPGVPPHPDEKAVAEGWNVDFEKGVDELLARCSVAQHVRDLMRALTGRDVFEELTRLVGGDWSNLYRQGQAFEDTAYACTIVVENVDRGRYLVQDKWDGNAANAAESWLAEYAAACRGHVEFMTGVSGRIKKFASAAYHAVAALTILVDTLLDALVDLLTRNAGAFIGGAISVLRGQNPLHGVVSVLFAVSKISSAIDALRAAAHVAVSGLQVLVANGEVVAKQWPCTPYDRKEV
ncbi:hypothetical protein AB0A74_23800 [Saccharothrix sp. NPDC042600]|uniref:hypothetical protein n=1 Tax=Saccharothrix TaxID=2071 RepID=UPI003406243F|nr:hypothetical protein GCM10017745_82030 [Saccharothrix mutabilis subsp. capreolus]